MAENSTFAEWTYTEALLPDLVARFLVAAEELRWRLSDTTNPMVEDDDGACRHDELVGCSWRCVRRTKAERAATRDEVRAFIRTKVGAAAFCYLDGIGESASSIEIEPLISALVAEGVRLAIEVLSR